MKIEMLYFLGIGWLHRSLLTSHRPARLAEFDRWWGGPEWTELKGLTQIEIATGMARRFQKELGYRFASPWPVFLREDGQRVPFYLIHASDHPEAPKLMTRAFTMIYGDRAGTPAHSQKEMFAPRDLG